MKTTINGEEEVKLLVRQFYGKVLQDEMLAPLFEYALENKWDQHLQLLDKFWMNVLFYTGGYTGNPMQVHSQLHFFRKLTKEHFAVWLRLFVQTVDELFEGEKAELAKQRAHSISTVMQLKILHQAEASSSIY
ncbi:group III truncated hemoglobin [Aridibaculum aurantiacum]|uniref:group III truncated hemoglobin n=1 Tax=Aridibaculum aurantiacum TaxID=2810307 RepID=UPI001A9789B9|nr:group III truncated hemoglobin [Aridibaculum aurantiacum]